MLIAKLSVATRDEVEGPTAPGPSSTALLGSTRNLKLEVRFATTLDWWRYLLAPYWRWAEKRLGRHLNFLPFLLLLVCGALICGTAWLSAFLAAHVDPGSLDFAFFKSLFWWIAPVLVAIGLTSHRPFCTIHLVMVHPHEPFPSIHTKVLNRKRTFVLAVRVLGFDAWRTLFGVLDRNPDEGHRSTSFMVTEPGKLPVQRISWEDYWSLARYCVGQLLPQSESDREFGKAAYFTYKQHRILIRVFLMLVGLSIVIPMCELWPKGWYPVKQVLALCGVTWATLIIIIHRMTMAHLERWEAVSRTYPFRGSPMFRCTSRPQGSQWAEVFTWDVEAPVHFLGLNYSQMYQLVLSIFLVIYLTLLQLIP